MAKNKVDVPLMKDTTYTTQGRQLSDIGGQGLLSNYNRVNMFSEPTQQSLQARVNDMSRKSELDYQRQYRQAANKLNQANYRRFGTLNATPAAYASNLQEIQNQDHLAKMAQQKAQAYDQVINNELQRRYNTINMYKALYGLGQTPYEMDVANIDRQYANELANAQGGVNYGKVGTGALSGAASGFLATGNPIGALVGGLGGAASSFFQ